jgi:hypothetical protein
MSICRRQSSLLRRAASIAMLAVSGLVATPAFADARPFGVLPEGALEITSQPSYDSGVELSSGRVVISGDFNRFSRLSQRADLLMLEPDGTRVAGFGPRCTASANPSAAARSCRGRLLTLPDGGFLLFGDFGAVDGIAARGVARFDGNGQRVAGYDPLRDTPGSVGAVALIGPWVHVSISGGAGGAVRRFSLAVDAVPDPSFQYPESATAIVGDNQGRPYLLSNAVVRLVPSTGALDPTWSSGLSTTVVALLHDSATNSLFVLQISETGGPRVVRRLRPEASIGVDPAWSVQPPGDLPDQRSWPRSIDGANGGRLLLTEDVQSELGFRARQRIIGASVGATQVVFDAERVQAVLAPRSTGGWLVGSPDVRLTDAVLLPQPGFLPRIRRSAGVNDVARAPDGRTAIVGSMSEVAGMPRIELARLQPDLSLDRGWPVVQLRSSAICGGSYRCVRARVGMHPSGAVIAIDQVVGSPIIFPPGPQPLISVVDGAGVALRYQRSNAGHVVSGSDGLLYFSPVPPSCAAQPNTLLGRVTLETLLAANCTADPSWGASDASSLTAPVIAEQNDFVYFAALEQFSTTAVSWRVRRIGTQAGAVVDPDFDIRVRTNPEGRLTLALDGDDLYVADRITTINGSPWAGPARFDRHNGQLDTSWQPGVDRRVLRMAAGGGFVFLMRSATPSSVNIVAYPIEIVRLSRGASAGSEQILTTDGTFGQRFQGDEPATGRILAIGDGRAIVAGHFSEIDGMPRDGFAIVGSVETILADDFE